MAAPNNCADHVVLVGIDGMGGYYIDKKLRDGTLAALCPTFAALLGGTLEGFDTVIGATNGRTVFPPVSAPAWASILSGLTPDQTGVDTKEWPLPDVDPATGERLQALPVVASPLNPAIPRSLFDMVPLARRGGDADGGEAVGRHLSIVGWDWLGAQLSGPIPAAVETMLWPPEERRLPDGSLRGVDDEVAAEFAQRFAAGGAHPSAPLPRFSFLHFDDVDHAGHVHEWGSEGFYASWLRADAQLAAVLAAVKGTSAAVVVLADHGGSEKGHGVTKTSHMLIPFVLAATDSCPKIVPISADEPAVVAAASAAAGGGGGDGAAICAPFHSSLNISAIDVAPTILALQGVDVSADRFLRGRALARYAVDVPAHK